MKKLLVLSTAIVSILLGSVIVLAQPAEVITVEPIQPQIVTVEPVQAPVVELIEVTPIVQDTVIAEPTHIVKQLTEAEIFTIINERFIKAPDGGVQVMFFVQYNLKKNYPDKFTEDNLYATLDYIDDFFPDNDINRVHYYIQNFHW